MYIRKMKTGCVVRLETGEDIIEALTELCEENHIHGGFFHGLGAVQSVVLGIYDMDNREYEWRRFDTPMELANITGNVSVYNGTVMIHAHGTFGDENRHAYAGHIKEAVVGPTCEVFLQIFEKSIERAMDNDIGLPLLSL